MRTVAIIGCGIGRAHLAEGYALLPDRFKVLALCDLDPARLAKVGDEFGVPRRTTRFADVLAMADVDIIDICTPPTLHVPQVLETLAAGKHAICEKPLTGGLADLDRLAAAEAAARGRVMPIFQYRFGDGIARARQIIGSGLAGRPYLATVETLWTRGADYYAVPWRGKWATELGGALVTHAIHAHDLLCWLMGPVRRVFARTATRVNPIEVEDCAAASLEMESGALATLSVTLGAQEEISRLRLCFEHVTFESCLSPYAPGDAPWRIIPASPAVEVRIAALPAPAPAPRRFAGQLALFDAALAADREFPVTLADARRALELATALYHSAATATDVALPLPASHPRYRSWQPS